MGSGRERDFITLRKRYVEWIRGSVMGLNMFCDGVEGYSAIKQKRLCNGMEDVGSGYVMKWKWFP